MPVESRPESGNRRPFRQENTDVALSPKSTGFSDPTGQHVTGPVVERPLSMQWLSEERIAEARRVWSAAYGRVISEEEAIEILTNVRRLAGVLLRIQEGKERP